ncbi:MAG: fumarate hydratase [Clostridia bacterium]|nr:fumarate hydratase [Clostridia bacterium]
MRELNVSEIQKAVSALLIRANHEMGADVREAVEKARLEERSPVARFALDQICENYRVSTEKRLPLCQDTGMAILFAEIGQDLHIVGGDFTLAVNAGVAEAYQEGYLRKSVVSDPLYDRVNTGNNCPAVIHTSIVPGDRLRLLAIAKGFGSENMSRIAMLPPAAGEEGVLDFIEQCVREAGPNPCPPVIVGVCVGGDFEQAALFAKRATARPVGTHNEDARYAALEQKALDRLNRLGIGAAGFGGTVTALSVAIDFLPTHIAGMPVAVSICCHACRHAEATL